MKAYLRFFKGSEALVWLRTDARGEIMGKGDWVALTIFLTIAFIVSLWTIDVSVAAIRAGGKLTNEFWMRSPGRAYHVGLWLAIASWFSLSVIAVKFIMGE
ncbi:hypothetical protein AKJ57_04755 [candidate division MSBL1 archaeon SCGC-AAA259A05]|uniref:Uncharacterized protein n=1 Tax=candidate division MSBL1 archaeon SCGC-AAA259A05 TaxID=1698259 RepID=A0A133U6S4_9EURY|nr:hypothetical protein AKJ57_04755 [candidate division MSBL1 archaeon SCGC-AAA259A05]